MSNTDSARPAHTDTAGRALVILSGGQDSTTCLYVAKKRHKYVRAITFNYGQRHRREIEAATIIASMADVEHEVLTLPRDILRGTSPLVSDAELEQYPDGNLPDGIEKTYVPHRNMLFLTIAANRATVHNCGHIYIGVSQEDFGGYPDCRAVFLDAFKEATMRGIEGASHPPAIHAPLLYFSKAETADLATLLPGCYYALAYSHTSYAGTYPPMEHDHATVLRAQGFEAAGLPDPLLLRAWYEGKMPRPPGRTYKNLPRPPMGSIARSAIGGFKGFLSSCISSEKEHDL